MSDDVVHEWQRSGVRETECDSLIVLVRERSDPDPVLSELLGALGVELEALGGGKPRPDAAETWRVAALDRLPAAEVVIAGAGDDPDSRQGAYEAAMAAGLATRGRRHVAVVAPEWATDEEIVALQEGLANGRYRYAGVKSLEPMPPVLTQRLTFLGDRPAPPGFGTGAKRAEVVASALSWARDLVNAPANTLTPPLLAEAAESAARQVGLEFRAWTEAELVEGRFGAIVGVGAGSSEPSTLVEVRYDGGAPDEPPIVLVGKGVTFDSGGLDIKSYAAMLAMKDDMGGAAAILGAIVAAARLGVRANLLALLPLVENMPGGAALRPGDVITHRNGLTTEVVSTDAEGRLILADALALAAERSPRAIVAVSTLTGATGAGAELWGVLASAPELAAALLAAGTAASDPGIELPLWRRYRRYLDSKVADQVNIVPQSPFPIDAVVASVFMDRFVPDDVPWAHLDVAATAFRHGLTVTPPWEAGATGSPLRALVRWLEDRAAGESDGHGA